MATMQTLFSNLKRAEVLTRAKQLNLKAEIAAERKSLAEQGQGNKQEDGAQPKRGRGGRGGRGRGGRGRGRSAVVPPVVESQGQEEPLRRRLFPENDDAIQVREDEPAVMKRPAAKKARTKADCMPAGATPQSESKAAPKAKGKAKAKATAKSRPENAGEEPIKRRKRAKQPEPNMEGDRTASGSEVPVMPDALQEAPRPDAPQEAPDAHQEAPADAHQEAPAPDAAQEAPPDAAQEAPAPDAAQNAANVFVSPLARDSPQLAQADADNQDVHVRREIEDFIKDVENFTLAEVKQHCVSRRHVLKKVQLVSYWSRGVAGIKVMIMPATPQVGTLGFSMVAGFNWNVQMVAAYAAAHSMVPRRGLFLTIKFI